MRLLDTSATTEAPRLDLVTTMKVAAVAPPRPVVMATGSFPCFCLRMSKNADLRLLQQYEGRICSS